MKSLVFPLFLILTFPLLAQINTPSGVSVPFGYNVEYAGHYVLPSNLPSGGEYDHAQHAADAYNAWKAEFVETCSGTPTKHRIKFDNTTETVSEGIGYGMLLAAYAADQDLFDGLWEYYKYYKNSRGLMHWKISGCASTLGQNGATDADLDAAMALRVADHQWQGQGYDTDAQTLITDIKDHEIHPAPSYQTSNGDGWLLGSSTCRNPSYQSPGYYRVFGAFTGNTAFWNQVATVSHTLLNANAHATTGLVSNWCNPLGTPNTCNGSLEYGFDACRHPWRMAVDAAWHGSTDAIALCDKITAYVDGVVATGIWNLKGPVLMDGSSAGLYHNSTFVATWAAGVVGTDATNQTLLNTLYDRTRTVEPNAPYFGSTLRVLSLFLMTGNFWNPDDVVDCPGGRSLNHDQIPDGIYKATTINSTSTVPASGDVAFKADQNISLFPGFEAKYNSLFLAEIVPCQPPAQKTLNQIAFPHQSNEMTNKEVEFKCSPNLLKAADILKIQYRVHNETSGLKMEIYHSSGKLMDSVPLAPFPKSGGGYQTYQVNAFPDGVYFFVLRTDDSILTGDKVVVQ